MEPDSRIQIDFSDTLPTPSVRISVSPETPQGNGTLDVRFNIRNGRLILDKVVLKEGLPASYKLSPDEEAFCRAYFKNHKPEDFGIGTKQYRFDHRTASQFPWTLQEDPISSFVDRQMEAHAQRLAEAVEKANSMSDLHCDLQSELAETYDYIYKKTLPDAEKVATVNKRRDDLLREVFG